MQRTSHRTKLDTTLDALFAIAVRHPEPTPISILADLLGTADLVEMALRALSRDGLISRDGEGRFVLTREGEALAPRMVGELEIRDTAIEEETDARVDWSPEELGILRLHGAAGAPPGTEDGVNERVLDIDDLDAEGLL